MLSLKEQVNEIIFDSIAPEEAIPGLIASVAKGFAEWCVITQAFGLYGFDGAYKKYLEETYPNNE